METDSIPAAEPNVPLSDAFSCVHHNLQVFANQHWQSKADDV